MLVLSGDGRQTGFDEVGWDRVFGPQGDVFMPSGSSGRSEGEIRENWDKGGQVAAGQVETERWLLPI